MVPEIGDRILAADGPEREDSALMPFGGSPLALFSCKECNPFSPSTVSTVIVINLKRGSM
jgi:hypothetical protein